VWINTPRRPWEACGTSGMKVLVNGGLNLSELDGWWAEAYTPEVGWALGDGQEHRRRPGLGRRRSRGPLRPAGTGGDPRVLCPRRARHTHGLGGADAESMARPDAALLRQPHGARVHRATLPTGRRGLARWPAGGRGRRLRLQRIGAGDASGRRLHAARDTEPCRGRGPSGGRSNPVAAVTGAHTLGFEPFSGRSASAVTSVSHTLK
jgi:hypothetical protein